MRMRVRGDGWAVLAIALGTVGSVGLARLAVPGGPHDTPAPVGEHGPAGITWSPRLAPAFVPTPGPARAPVLMSGPESPGTGWRPTLHPTTPGGALRSWRGWETPLDHPGRAAPPRVLHH